MAAEPLQPGLHRPPEDDSSGPQHPAALPAKPQAVQPSPSGGVSDAPATIPVSDEVLAQQNSPVRSILGLIDHDVRVLAALVVLAAFVMVGHYAYLTFRGRQPVRIDRTPKASIEYRIDLNSAHWMELAQLKGIGETLGRRIVEYRENNGPFTNVEQLQEVRGIGPAKLAQMRPYVNIAEDSAGIPKAVSPEE